MHKSIVFFLGVVFVGLAYAQYNNNLSGNSDATYRTTPFHDSASIIRKMHPEFLLHKRDKTLRQGVRTEEDSLKECVNCHANINENTGHYIGINEQDQFCSSCHKKVSISVDCFSCHRTTPAEGY
ncbi:MAG: sulfur reduction protein DsrJ [PS1 clade bacterium]